MQHENHYSSLSKEEIASEGFLIYTHSLELLQELNSIAPHTIAISSNKVIAFLLTMIAIAEESMPFLKPMVQEFRTTTYNKKTIANYNYLIVDQVCVAKEFRGQGVLNHCYDLYRK